jgi:hypothetical protein
VREAQPVDLQMTAATQQAAAAPQATAPSSAAASRVFLYNTTQFVYRQDIGRIVLIGQSPETGERTIQIPSEEALRAYERTMRSEEQKSLLNGRQEQQQARYPQQTSQPASPAPKPVALPDLAQAVSAVFGGANQNSAIVSISA